MKLLHVIDSGGSSQKARHSKQEESLERAQVYIQPRMEGRGAVCTRGFSISQPRLYRKGGKK